MLAALSLLVCLVLQEPAPAPALPPVQTVGTGEDVHETMRRMVQQIETRMKSLDRDLWEASGPQEIDAPTEGLALGERLRLLEADQERIVADIDTLLEIAAHPHGSGGS